MQFALLDRRLRQFGSHYGALPAHAGLWEAAQTTADDALARRALVHMVPEARGLDVPPAPVERFQAPRDGDSAKTVSHIDNDAIRHVTAGTVWVRPQVGQFGKGGVR